MARLVSVVAEALRLTFRRDALPPPPPLHVPTGRPGRLAHLFAPEPLPPPPPAPDPSAAAPPRGALALLLAPEPLPPDLPPAPRRRGRWLSWFLSPEPLDHP